MRVSNLVKDEQSGLSIQTLRNCLDPRHGFLLDPYRGGGAQVCKTKMSISMWSAPSGVERRRDTSKLATCSHKKTSKVVAVLRALSERPVRSPRLRYKLPIKRHRPVGLR